MSAVSSPSSETRESLPAASARPAPWLLQHAGQLSLGLALVLGLLHGLLYLRLMPPWQHYDEPKHFEVVWLAAHQATWPKPGDNHPALSRAVTESMIAHGFYRGSQAPDVNASDWKPKIEGYTQLDEPPLYYFLASLPLRQMPAEPTPANIDSQLYAARGISLLLLLVTLAAAWGFARQLSPAWWSLLLPVGLALQPGFVENMTAVNNDVAAIAVFSLFLWGAVRLVQQDGWLFNLGWVLVAAVLAWFAKSTALPALVLLPVAIGLRLVRDWPLKWQRAVAGLVGLVVVAGLLVATGTGDASGFYRASDQVSGLRIASEKARLGTHVLQVEVEAAPSPTWTSAVFQPLEPAAWEAIQGQSVTVGAWMWANQPVDLALAPVLHVGATPTFQTVRLTTQPQFVAYHTHVPAGGQRSLVALEPGIAGNVQRGLTVYYDGLVVTTGLRPLSEAPQFSSPQAERGVWGDQPFENLIRNASFETPGLRLRPVFDRWGAKILPDQTRPSLALASVLDLPHSFWFFWASLIRLGSTFWGLFGWGHVPLLGSHPYLWLSWLVYWMLAGALLALFLRRKRLAWHVVLFLGLALVLVWSVTVLRGVAYMGYGAGNMYLAVARYGFPAILPTFWLLIAGWLEWWRRLPGARALAWGAGTLLALLLALDVWAVVSVMRFYRAG